MIRNWLGRAKEIWLKNGKNVETAIAELEECESNLENGGASTLLGSNLTTNRVLVSSSAGKVIVSTITTTLLGYLSGLTSNVQTQLNTLSTKLSNLISSLTSFSYKSFTYNGLTFVVYARYKTAEFKMHSGSCTSALSAYTAYTVGTIASGYRPKYEINKYVILKEGVMAQLYITTSGVVTITPLAEVPAGWSILIHEVYNIA